MNNQSNICQQHSIITISQQYSSWETANVTTSNSAAVTGSITTVSIVVGSSVPSNGQFYEPNPARTTVGSMVTWVNDDTAPHTVTSGTVERTLLHQMEGLILGS